MSESLNEDSIFSKKIEENEGICSNCYRRVKSYSKPNYTEMADCVTDKAEYENHVGWSWFDDREKSGRSSVKRAYCECGNVDDAKLRPLDRKEVMMVATRIEAHLEEMDNIEIDSDKYYSYLRENRDGSDIQFNVEKYYEEAIDEALITNEKD
jgi:hypothetical protein